MGEENFRIQSLWKGDKKSQEEGKIKQKNISGEK